MGIDSRAKRLKRNLHLGMPLDRENTCTLDSVLAISRKGFVDSDRYLLLGSVRFQKGDVSVSSNGCNFNLRFYLDRGGRPYNPELFQITPVGEILFERTDQYKLEEIGYRTPIEKRLGGIDDDSWVSLPSPGNYYFFHNDKTSSLFSSLLHDSLGIPRSRILFIHPDFIGYSTQ